MMFLLVTEPSQLGIDDRHGIDQFSRLVSAIETHVPCQRHFVAARGFPSLKCGISFAQGSGGCALERPAKGDLRIFEVHAR
jgi:hypothetical protein